MINLRKNKFIKIICLVLVFCFGSQQLGLAEVTDLRDTPGSFDVVVAILAGYMAGKAIKTSWSTSQMFMYTYMVPALSKQVVNMVGIKGTAGLVATTMLSAFAVSKMDYTTSADQLAKVGDKAQQTLAQSGERSLSGFAKGVVNQAKSLFAGGVPMQGAIIDAVTAGAMMAAKQVILGLFKKAKKYITALIDVLVTYLGQYVRVALQRSFGVLLGFNKDFGPTAEKPMIRVYYSDGTSDVMSVADAAKVDMNNGYAISQEEVLRDPVTGQYVAGRFEQALEVQDVSFKQVFRNNAIFAGVQTVFLLLGFKRETALALSALTGNWMVGASFAEAVTRAAISAVLQTLSRQFRNPMHGTLILMGLGDLLNYALIDKNKVKAERLSTDAEVEADINRVRSAVQADIEKNRANLSEADIASIERSLGVWIAGQWDKQGKHQLLSLVDSAKDLDLLDTIFIGSVNNANIDMMTFGRAQYGSGSPYSLRWVKGNDVFFLNRYADYVKDVYDYGVADAMMGQFISAYHNQTVNDFYNAVSGQIRSVYPTKRLAKNYWDDGMEAAQRFADKRKETVELVLAGEKEWIDMAKTALPKDSAATVAPEGDAIQQTLVEIRKGITTAQDEVKASAAALRDISKDDPGRVAAENRVKDAQDKLAGLIALHEAGTQIEDLSRYADPKQLRADSFRLGDKDKNLAIGLHVFTLIDPLLAGQGASDLSMGRDNLDIAMGRSLEALKIISAALGTKSETGKKVDGDIKELMALRAQYKSGIQDFEEIAVTNRWQILAGTSGQPYIYSSIGPNTPGLEYSADAENYTATLPERILAQGKGQRLFGVAKYLDMIGGNPVYYARWGKIDESRPEPEPALALSPVSISPSSLPNSALPVSQDIASIPQPKITTPGNVPQPAAIAAAPAPERMVIRQFTQFPEYDQGSAQGAKYYQAQGTKIEDLPQYQVVKYVEHDANGNLVNIDGKNVGRVEVRAIQDGQEVWVDTGRRIDMEKGFEWTQKSPTHTFRGITQGGVTKTELKREANPLPVTPVPSRQSGLIQTRMPAESGVAQPSLAPNVDPNPIPQPVERDSNNSSSLYKGYDQRISLPETNAQPGLVQTKSPGAINPQSSLQRIGNPATPPIEYPTAPESEFSAGSEPIAIGIQAVTSLATVPPPSRGVMTEPVSLPEPTSPDTLIPRAKSTQVPVPKSFAVDAKLLEAQTSENAAITKIVVPVTAKALSPQVQAYADSYASLSAAKYPRQEYERFASMPVPKNMAQELVQQLPADFDPSKMPPPQFVKVKRLVGYQQPLDSLRSGDVEYYDAYVPVFESREQEIVYLLMSSTGGTRNYPYYTHTYNSDPTTRTDVTGKVARPDWAKDFWSVARQLGVNRDNPQNRSIPN